MIFVGGVSGAGKTTAIERFVQDNPTYLHISASRILRQNGRVTIGANLEELEENQIFLVQYLKRLTLDRKSIFDGHAVIPTETAVYRVPMWFFGQLPISALILMRVAPKIVLKRRLESPDEMPMHPIISLQNDEYNLMKSVSSNLNVPFNIVEADNPSDFKKVLLTL